MLRCVLLLTADKYPEIKEKDKLIAQVKDKKAKALLNFLFKDNQTYENV